MGAKTLENQRAVITGGSTGIGAAIARKFAAAGAFLWLAGGRDEAGLRRTVESCRAHGVEADGKCYDLSDAKRASDIIHEGAEFLGGLDILVNCAGTRCHHPVTEYTDEEVDLLFEVNAKATFIASREAARLMIPQESGCILNIGSVAGEAGVAGNALYCATKTTMHNLTRALAAELGPKGIRVNCLAPGTVSSERVQKMYAEREEYAAKKLEGIPVGRYGEMDEMAALARFMVSKENSFMNGAIVVSDGGLLAT